MAFDSAETRLQRIRDILKNNTFTHHTTILTGSNGSGKSFIRKAIGQKIQMELEASGEKFREGHIVASVSMERRTSSDPFCQAMNAFSHDASWNPTSEETFRFVTGLLGQDDRYLVIDEPEIGMAEELQLLLCNEINNKLLGLNSFGVLIITHSRTIVKNVIHDQFLNMDGLDENQWLTREPKLPDYTFEEFEKASHELFLEIEKAVVKKK
jgi:predicted ATPase